MKRRIIRAGSWTIVRRLIKPVPIIGTIFAFGLAGYEIKRKGLLPGAVHVGLDMTPIVGTAKGVIEFFTGDLIPDKAVRLEKKRMKHDVSKQQMNAERHRSEMNELASSPSDQAELRG